MPYRNSRQTRRNERIVITGLVLLTVFWLVDTTLETVSTRMSCACEVMALPAPLQTTVHLLILLTQFGLIMYVRRLFRERKRMEEAATEQSLFMQQLLDTIPTPIYHKDTTGHFTGCNAAFERAVGQKKAEIIGKTSHDLSPRELADTYHTMDRQLIENPGTQGFEADFLSAVGGTRPVIFNKATWLNAAGEPAGIVGIISDISELKIREQEIHQLNEALAEQAESLADKNRELEAFCYSLSHDLNTHLTRIACASQELQELYAPVVDEVARFYIQTIVDAEERAEELIDAMLLLSQVTKGELEPEVVDLSDLVQDAAVELRHEEPGRQVSWHIAPGLLATADRRIIKVALDNLLANAWKYTRKEAKAEITFGSVAAGEQRAFFIRDNGAGFSMDEANRLFLPFNRLHPASEFPGTGIGLATVQRAIERHGGSVWAEGKPGRGATFYFTLP